MKASLLLLVAPLGVWGSLNCTLTAPLELHCCPDSESELINTFETGRLVMLGCASDDTSDGRWFWNYNTFYTPTTTEVTDCRLGDIPFNSTDVLPNCSEDTYVLQLTEGKEGPLDPCNPNCVTDEDWPENTYFGDTWEDLPTTTTPPRM